ncbi:MAG: hypothetical protein AAFY38_10725 [Pseudomonadota bacterium]
MPDAMQTAVREGRIPAVGDASGGDPWGAVARNDRLVDSVLRPGLVEAHAHMMAAPEAMAEKALRLGAVKLMTVGSIQG